MLSTPPAVPVIIDKGRPLPLSFRPFAVWRPQGPGGYWKQRVLVGHSHEKNVSTQQPEAQPYPRFSGTHEDRQRPQGAEEPSCQGPGAADGLIPSPRLNRGGTFPRRARLTSAAQFESVFASTCKSSSGSFTVLARPNGLAQARLGIVVSKRCSKLAVERNRLKRLVRENFRLVQQRLAGLDLVVIARPAAVKRDNRQLAATLQRHWKELQACKGSPSSSSASTGAG